MKNYVIEKICPICHNKVTSSDYLESLFKDNPKVNYLAHLVTHYRHNHIQSWDRCWGRYGGRYRQHWFGDYDEEKRKINERAKRQLIKKGHVIFKEYGIVPEDFLGLQNTELKTIEVANKYLSEKATVNPSSSKRKTKKGQSKTLPKIEDTTAVDS